MTIVEAARAMMYDQDMSKFLWAEACNTTVYVQNRTPYRALGKITPEQVFTEKTPEVSDFRIFGSLAYRCIPEEKRKKLDQTAEKGYLAGYNENARHIKSIFQGARRNYKRERKHPDRYHALVAQVGEPSSFQEAAQHQVWVDVMVGEYSSIMVNDVWEVVPRPQDRSVVGLRWIYKIKYAIDDSVEKYKARFVAKGYAQKKGIDYKGTFSPVARYTSIRTVISLAA
eukprot:PITA_32345